MGCVGIGVLEETQQRLPHQVRVGERVDIQLSVVPYTAVGGNQTGGPLFMVQLREVDADQVVVVKQSHVSRPVFDGIRRRLPEETVGARLEVRTVCLACL